MQTGFVEARGFWVILPTENLIMKLFIETFGCQMNFSDSEIVASILTGEGYSIVTGRLMLMLIFLNTCAIRDNAEQRVRKRLREFRG
jgi:tRNA-2-methylthio-N6-dimethylallyladenosine synthase